MIAGGAAIAALLVTYLAWPSQATQNLDPRAYPGSTNVSLSKALAIDGINLPTPVSNLRYKTDASWSHFGSPDALILTFTTSKDGLSSFLQRNSAFCGSDLKHLAAGTADVQVRFEMGWNYPLGGAGMYSCAGASPKHRDFQMDIDDRETSSPVVYFFASTAWN